MAAPLSSSGTEVEQQNFAVPMGGETELAHLFQLGAVP